MLEHIDVVVKMCEKYCDSEKGRLRLAAVVELATLRKLLSTVPRFPEFLTEMQVTAIKASWHRLMVAVLAVKAAETVENQTYLWRITPKFHLMAHICNDLVKLFGSPSNFACWGGEDYMGQLERFMTNNTKRHANENHLCHFYERFVAREKHGEGLVRKKHCLETQKKIVL